MCYKHKLWLNGNKKGCQIDIYNCDLSYFDFSGFDMSWSIMNKTNLKGSILNKTNLSESRIVHCDFTEADLFNADLKQSILRSCIFKNADLSFSYLSGAQLSYSNFHGCDLSEAELYNANVCHNQYIISVCLGDYRMYAYRDINGFRITSGCRKSFTIQQARDHWSLNSGKFHLEEFTIPKEEYLIRQIAMLDFLLEQAKILGWNTDA